MMHIVVLPFPALSHINSLHSIARVLRSHGFRITFVLTHEMALKFPHTDGHTGSIRYVAIPSVSFEELARNSTDSSSWLTDALINIVKSMRDGFEKLLRDLEEPAAATSTTKTPRVSCIIADYFMTWSQQAAAPFGIPVFSFVTTNAHALATYLHIDVLIAQGICPIRKDGDRQQGPEWVDSIPGVGRVRVKDLPVLMQGGPHFVAEVAKGIRRAEGGVIVNTAWEVEGEAMEVVMKELKNKVYAIGPLLLQVVKMEKEGKVAKSVDEENKCLEWLDERMKEGSPVVYVSFGSIANAGGKEQVTELAQGLEASGEAFLWVARPNAIAHSPLPHGFLDRTQSRGLVVPWSPQLQVLCHPSIAAFVTHCGWNSIVENLCTGCHPMICWPQMAEQRLNARTLVAEWGVAIDLPAEDGEEDLVANGGALVKSEAVVEALKQVMRGKTREGLKQKACELKEAMVRSVGDGGRSHAALRELVQDIIIVHKKEEGGADTESRQFLVME